MRAADTPYDGIQRYWIRAGREGGRCSGAIDPTGLLHHLQERAVVARTLTLSVGASFLWSLWHVFSAELLSGVLAQRQQIVQLAAVMSASKTAVSVLLR